MLAERSQSHQVLALETAQDRSLAEEALSYLVIGDEVPVNQLERDIVSRISVDGRIHGARSTASEQGAKDEPVVDDLARRELRRNSFVGIRRFPRVIGQGCPLTPHAAMILGESMTGSRRAFGSFSRHAAQEAAARPWASSAAYASVI